MDCSLVGVKRSNVITGYTDDNEILVLAINNNYENFVDRILHSLENENNIYRYKEEWQHKYNNRMVLNKKPICCKEYAKIIYLKGERNNLEFAKRIIDNLTDFVERLDNIYYE